MVFVFFLNREFFILFCFVSIGDKEIYYEWDVYEEFVVIEEEDSDDVKDNKNLGCVLND